MKKQLILGITFALSANFAFAGGPVRSALEVKNHMTEETKKSKDRNSIDALHGLMDSQVSGKAATELSKIGGGDAAEIQAALSKPALKIPTAEGERTLPLLQVAQKLLNGEQNLKKLNRNEMTAEGKLHVDALESFIKTGSEFLSLRSKVSKGTTEQEKMEIAALDKQILIIHDQMTTMDTADLKSHTAKMSNAIKARISPDITGDQAFAASLKQGKTPTEYAQLLKDLLGCI